MTDMPIVAQAAPRKRPRRVQPLATNLPAVKSAPVDVAEVASPGTLLAAITRLAGQREIRVDLLQLLLDRQERAEAREAERQYRAAMNAAQAEILPIVKNTPNTATGSFYAQLEAVDAIIRPIYVKHGFSLSFDQVAPLQPGFVRIECRCAHIGGHVEVFGREAPPDTLGPKGNPVKTPLHGVASADTFLKRYITVGIFNVVLKGMDKDGNRPNQPNTATGAVISVDQLTRISQLIHQTKSDMEAFLQHVVPGTTRLRDIRAADYSKCITALETKRRRMAEKEAA
jgi:hypothetical protein